MARKPDEWNAAMDGHHIEQIGRAERGMEALERGRPYKGYVFLPLEDFEEAKDCFREIRRGSLDCNGARNEGKEEYLTCGTCPIAERLLLQGMEAGRQMYRPLKLAS